MNDIIEVGKLYKFIRAYKISPLPIKSVRDFWWDDVILNNKGTIENNNNFLCLWAEKRYSGHTYKILFCGEIYIMTFNPIFAPMCKEIKE